MSGSVVIIGLCFEDAGQPEVGPCGVNKVVYFGIVGAIAYAESCFYIVFKCQTITFFQKEGSNILPSLYRNNTSFTLFVPFRAVFGSKVFFARTSASIVKSPVVVFKVPSLYSNVNGFFGEFERQTKFIVPTDIPCYSASISRESDFCYFFISASRIYCVA